MSLPSNATGDLGPNAASFPSWFRQWPATAPATAGPVLVAAVGIVSTGGSYSSGGTGCTNGTQTVTYIDAGAIVNATGTITVVGGVPVGSISLTNGGAGYTSVPTTVQVATCTGTTTITGAATSPVVTMSTGTLTGTGNTLVTNAGPTFGVNGSSNGFINLASSGVEGSATIANSSASNLSLTVPAQNSIVLVNGTQTIASFIYGSDTVVAEQIGTSGAAAGGAGVTGQLNLANATASTGGYVTIRSLGSSTGYNLNLPTTAGSAGNIWVSGGGGTNSSTWDTTSGSGTVVLLQTSPAIATPTITGLGTSTGTLYLCINGSQVVSQASSACGTSLLAVKENVQSLDDGLVRVMQMRPVTFNWKEDGRPDIGMIADWTAAIDPVYGVYDKDGKLENWRDRSVLATAIKAIQELKQENDSLKSRIEALEAR